MFVHGLIRGLVAKRDIHRHTTFSSDCIDITETIHWLKSLKERVRVQLQPNLDDKQLKLLNELMSFLLTDCPKQWAKYGELLKSFKPQNTWKPSYEQMLAISTAIGMVGKYTLTGQCLEKMLEQLKKLKE
jgi:hypothetical protein